MEIDLQTGHWLILSNAQKMPTHQIIFITTTILYNTSNIYTWPIKGKGKGLDT